MRLSLSFETFVEFFSDTYLCISLPLSLLYSIYLCVCLPLLFLVLCLYRFAPAMFAAGVFSGFLKLFFKLNIALVMSALICFGPSCLTKSHCVTLCYLSRGSSLSVSGSLFLSASLLLCPSVSLLLSLSVSLIMHQSSVSACARRYISYFNVTHCPFYLMLSMFLGLTLILCTDSLFLFLPP